MRDGIKNLTSNLTRWVGLTCLVTLSVSYQARAEGGAGAVLQGVAANIAAVSPIVTAGIQAQAEKAIAGINAEATVAMTRIASDTSKFLSTNQKEVALAQTFAAQNINTINQNGVTERLKMQLNELRDSREQQFELEREKLDMERELNAARIDLAKKQADANLKLAEKTLDAQLVQAGLSTGFKRKNSGARLTSSGTLLGDDLSAGSSSVSGEMALGVRSASSGRLLASLDKPEGGSTLPTSRETFRSPLGVERPGIGVQNFIQSNSLARGSLPGSLVRRSELSDSPVRAVASDLSQFNGSAVSTEAPVRRSTAPASQSTHTAFADSTHRSGLR